MVTGLWVPAPVMSATTPDGGRTNTPASFASQLATTAEARYNKSLATASQQYLGDLDNAQKAALNAGNLDEANAINAIRKQLERK